MKKFMSFMLAMLMAVAMLPSAAMTCVASASGEYENSVQRQFTITAPGGDVPSGGDDTPADEHILLSGDNFTIPDYTNGGYINNGGTATGNLFSKSVKIAGEDASKYITARVYIKEAGTYNLWVLSANELDVTNASFTSRVARAGFDGEFADYTPHKVHVWEKSMWELGEGWHTLNVGMKNAWGNVLVNAVYITGDLDETPDASRDDYLTAYHDTEAPVFAPGADVETSFEDGAFKVKFPAATDTGSVIYEYRVGSTATAIANIEAFVAVNGLAGTGEVVLAAYDKWGNKAEKAFTVTVPRTKWMLTWNNFVKPEFGHQTNWAYNASRSLGNKSIFMNTVPNYRAESNAARAKAMFYVEIAGNYTVWALSRNDKISDGRTAKIYVDGTPDNTVYNDSTSFVWGKGTGPENGSGSWSLEKGWHTVEFGLKAEYKPCYLDAIYITSDANETVTVDNDDALLASYGGSSVYVDGKLYIASGLEASEFVTDDAAVNVKPVAANNTGAEATVTINNIDAVWNEPISLALNKGINTVTVRSSDNTADCSFKVVSRGKVINHRDTEATVTGGIESTIVGEDGVTKTVYLESASSTAKFSAAGVVGKIRVYVHVVGAENLDASTAPEAVAVVKDSAGEKNNSYDSSRTVALWTSLGVYSFSGSDDEYVLIKGKDGAHVYIDSVKFVSADEYIFSAPQKVNTDGKIKFVYEFYKQSDALKTPAVVIAEYTGDKLSNISINNVSLTDAGIYTASTNELSTSEGAVYKGFIWDSITNITPLAEAAQ